MGCVARRKPRNLAFGWGLALVPCLLGCRGAAVQTEATVRTWGSVARTWAVPAGGGSAGSCAVVKLT